MLTLEINIDLLPTLPAIHVIIWDIYTEAKQDPSCDFIIISGFELHASFSDRSCDIYYEFLIPDRFECQFEPTVVQKQTNVDQLFSNMMHSFDLIYSTKIYHRWQTNLEPVYGNRYKQNLQGAWGVGM